MKKSIIAIAIAGSLVMTGCSTFSKTEAQKQQDVQVSQVEFLKEHGGVSVKFDDMGNWISVQSTGVAETSGVRFNAAHEAYEVATLRAQRNLSEYLTQDVTSKVTLDTFSDLAKTEDKTVDGDALAYKLSENIIRDSHAMLQGVMIVKRDYDEDNKMVSVTIEVSKNSMKAAGQIRDAIAVRRVK